MVSPLAWLLDRQGLSPRGWDIQSLDVALKGTIAHKVFELHFDAKKPFSFDEYDHMFDEAIRKEASYLHEPRWRMEKVQLKHEVHKALQPFIDWCDKEGWSIALLEKRLEGQLFGLTLKGYVDAIFTQGDKALVLDYKKSKSDNFVKRLNSGFDLQTMIYRRLYEQGDYSEDAVHSGYYALNDRRLVLDFFEETDVENIKQVQLEITSIKKQSQQAEQCIKELIKQLKSGVVELNSEDDKAYWEAFGIKSVQYAIDDNPIINQFLKAAEESENE